MKIENIAETNKAKEKEERIKRMKERAEHIDSLPNEEIINIATTMLDRLGLTFDDLVDKRVLDLGSGTQIIERAATIKGTGTVLSVDSRDYVLSKRPEVKNGIVANIKKGISQIPDNSIDLIISHAGPPGIFAVSGKKEGFDFSITEILRMLKEGGEARITSLAWGFIEQKYGRYQELLKKIYQDKKELTPDEAAEETRIWNIIKEESLKYLQEKGINIFEKKDEGKNWSYGVIKK